MPAPTNTYTWHVCWKGHVYREDRLPAPGTGGCYRQVFSQNVQAWLTCGCAVRQMTDAEEAAYRMGGESAILDLYPGRELIPWPWT